MNRRKVICSSSLFRGLDFKPEAIIEGALYVIVHGLYGATANPQGDYLIYRGSINLRTSCLFNPVAHFETVLRYFSYYSEQYRRLEPEENYIGDQNAHHNFLRVVVTTATCAYWLQHPRSLEYATPFDGSFDLSYLPPWATKLIKKAIFTETKSIRFEYYSYDQITEE